MALFRRQWQARSAKHSSDEIIDQLTASRIRRARLTCVDGSFKVFAVSMLPTACIVGSGVYFGRQGVMTPQQDLAFLVAYATVVLRMIFPGIVNKRTLPFWYGYCMLLLAALHAPVMQANRESILVHSSFAQVQSFLFSVGCFQFRTSLFWNSTHDVAQVIAYRFADEASLEHASLAEFMEQSLYCFVVKMFLLYLIEKLLVLSIQGEVEATKERGLRYACNSLLSIICDSVVELDRDHRIVDHVPTLAHTLLHAGGKTFKGADVWEGGLALGTSPGLKSGSTSQGSDVTRSGATGTMGDTAQPSFEVQSEHRA